MFWEKSPAACRLIAVVVLGLLGSLVWDTPSGPTIVVAAAALFALSLIAPAAERGG